MGEHSDPIDAYEHVVTNAIRQCLL